MKISRTLLAMAVISLNVSLAWPVAAQPSFNLNSIVNFSKSPGKDRAKEVMQDNELVVKGKPAGTFLCNPLLLNGRPLDYATFSLLSEGELTLTKGAAVTGNPTKIPFYIYLRRNGTIIQLQGEEASKPNCMKIDIAKILKYAKPGDQLIIEPANNEDWQAKRILMVLEDLC